MNAIEEESGPVEPTIATLARSEGSFRRFWRRLGGGSLMTATLLHAGLLLVATTIVMRSIREAEQPPEFLPGPRGGGGMGGSEGFGRGNGKGNGVGPGSGSGIGMGGLGTGTVFFKQEIHAGRVAYVIDYSLSMRGKREKLMRAELAKSVANLSPTMQFQLIFFCGPVWIAGDQFEPKDDGTVVITHGKDKDKYRWTKGDAPGSWEPKGRRPKAEWLTADSSTVEEAVKNIKETPLQSGTHWVSPLEMALAMKPPPEVIFFMTDGASPGTTEEDIRRLGNRAKSLKVTINTMAMMEPDAEEGMKELAKRSGGSFAIIEADGSVRDVPVN